MVNETSETKELLESLANGSSDALGTLLQLNRPRLLCMVELRMDARLRGRIDPADVLQETFIEASKRIDQFLHERKMPFFIWLRFLAAQKLSELHRKHLKYKMRDARRERSIYAKPMPEATSAVLAAQLIGRESTPSKVASRGEIQIRLQEALDSMDDMDREVLVLRHFEQLSNNEAAQVLGIGESTASSRHLRAIGRLKSILSDLTEL